MRRVFFENAEVKVLLVGQYALPHLGGVETAIENLAVGLARRGHQATIFSSNCGEGPEPDPLVRRVRVPAWNGFERGLGVPYPLFAPGLGRALRREVEACDLVHIHAFLPHSSLVALGEALRAGKPLVVTEHTGPKEYANRVLNLTHKLALHFLVGRFLASASAIICLNKRVEEWLRERMKNKGLLTLIPNGIDLGRFRPAAANEQAEARKRLGVRLHGPVVLYAGRFAPSKNVEHLLSTRDRNFDLLLCGPGLPSVDAFGAPVTSICVPPAEMPYVYRAADILVLPSQGEGFPMVVMEAMATGLPVVVGRDPAYDSLVDGVEIVQTDLNPTSVGNTVRALLSNPQTLLELGLAARRRAAADFASERSADRHLSVYSTAIHSAWDPRP